MNHNQATFDDLKGRMIPFVDYPTCRPIAVEIFAGALAVFLTTSVMTIHAVFIDKNLACVVVGAVEMAVSSFPCLAAASNLGEAWAFNQWLTDGLVEARNKRLYQTEEELVRAAQKHDLEILRREAEITARYDWLFSNKRWIRYLMANEEAGGGEILAFYREERELLRLANAVENAVSYEERRRRRLVEELSQLRVRNRTEVEAELEEERLRAKANGNQAQPLPWEMR